MTKDDILKLGTPEESKLREVCKRIFSSDLEIGLYGILRTMRDFVHDQNNYAVGLALPQLGILQRGFVMRLKDGSVLTLINPVLIHKGHKVGNALESCLSEPGVEKVVCRYYDIDVSFQLLSGNRITKHFEGFEARIAQHELDHLDGILLSDK